MNREAPTPQAPSRTYFVAFPDGWQRQALAGVSYFRVTPQWLHYSDFSIDPPESAEFSAANLREVPIMCPPRGRMPRLSGRETEEGVTSASVPPESDGSP